MRTGSPDALWEEAARLGGFRRAPDGQWIYLYRSNMLGPTYVLAVEVAKAAASKPAQ